MIARILMTAVLALSLPLTSGAAAATETAVNPHEWLDPAVPAEDLDLPESPRPLQAPSANEAPSVISVAEILGPGAATALNDRGLVVGHTDGDPWMQQRQSGRRTALPTLGASAWPEAINQRGEAVGSAVDSITGQRKAVIWRGQRIHRLPDLGGDAAATGINRHGVISGWADDEGGTRRAVLWRREQLTVLPDGGNGAAAYDVNDQGDIAGTHVDALGHGRAVLWRGGELISLAPMIDDPEDEFTATSAHALGNGGHIVGTWELIGANYPGYILHGLDGAFIRLFGVGFLFVPRAVDRTGRSVGWGLDEMFFEVPHLWLPDGTSVLLGGLGDPALVPVSSGQAFDVNERGVIAGTARTYRMMEGNGFEFPWPDERRAVLWELP